MCVDDRPLVTVRIGLVHRVDRLGQADARANINDGHGKHDDAEEHNQDGNERDDIDVGLDVTSVREAHIVSSHDNSLRSLERGRLPVDLGALSTFDPHFWILFPAARPEGVIGATGRPSPAARYSTRRRTR